MSEDQKFFDIYSVVVGGLALFSFFILILALNMGDATQGEYVRQGDEYRDAIVERIAPVGSVRMPGEAAPAAATPAPAPVEEVVAAALSGGEVYTNACAVCHTAGVAGAPVLGDVDGWTARIAKGTEVLVDHAINGFQGEVGYMPPRGGNMALSDDEVTAAVEYMVNESS